MFNPHIHQQQHQQQQQFQQHLRQLQHLFQQQPPPPPPQPPPAHHVSHHHRQSQRAISVPQQPAAPPPRMVNLCQASQTTIIGPNPMLQGALLMQQMQGNMRGYAMGGQQFRQFFAAGARSSLLGPVPMGVAIKSPIMGFPAARHFHQHGRYYNNSNNPSASNADFAARQPDRKRDNEQRAGESVNGQPSTSSGSESGDKASADGAAGGTEEHSQHPLEEVTEGPAPKKQRTEGAEEPKAQPAAAAAAAADDDDDDDGVLMSESNDDTAEGDPNDCILLEEGGSTAGSDAVEALEESRVAEVPSDEGVRDGQPASSPLEEAPLQMEEEDPQEEPKEGANKFYCYLCSITCHNQQNFRSHMNGISHQQRMMEIQHMSNACLVTLLPRVQESLHGAQRDGEKRGGQQRWCATCQTNFTSNVMDHRRTKEHKLACRTVSPSCTVCKKHFRSAQLFVEHMQSQTHKQRAEECHGAGGLELLAAMDPEGCLVDEQEDDSSEVGQGDERHGNTADGSSSEQEGWSGRTEVSLKDMDTDDEYEPDTVYGSSFLAPVAGFLCRLCNRFYHFESTALHSHCKSLAHFENLKKYRALHRHKAKAPEPSSEPLAAGASEAQLSTDQCLAGSLRPVITATLSRVAPGSGSEETEELTSATETGPARPDPLTPSEDSPAQESLAELPDRMQEGSECQPGQWDQKVEEEKVEEEKVEEEKVEEKVEEEVEEEKVEEEKVEKEEKEKEKEKEEGSGPARKAGAGKAKPASRRRSGRAACRH